MFREKIKFKSIILPFINCYIYKFVKILKYNIFYTFVKKKH